MDILVQGDYMHIATEFVDGSNTCYICNSRVSTTERCQKHGQSIKEKVILKESKKQCQPRLQS